MVLVKARDLQLGDRVRYLGLDTFNTAIVKEITDTEIKLFRPYGATADFSYIGGVICYVGIEEFNTPRNDQEYEVLHSVVLR